MHAERRVHVWVGAKGKPGHSGGRRRRGGTEYTGRSLRRWEVTHWWWWKRWEGRGRCVRDGTLASGVGSCYTELLFAGYWVPVNSLTPAEPHLPLLWGSSAGTAQSWVTRAVTTKTELVPRACYLFWERGEVAWVLRCPGSCSWAAQSLEISTGWRAPGKTCAYGYMLHLNYQEP